VVHQPFVTQSFGIEYRTCTIKFKPGAYGPVYQMCCSCLIRLGVEHCLLSIRYSVCLAVYLRSLLSPFIVNAEKCSSRVAQKKNAKISPELCDAKFSCAAFISLCGKLVQTNSAIVQLTDGINDMHVLLLPTRAY